MLGEILQGKGYGVISASNGVDGIQKYHAHQEEIGMVISDLGMPIMGGQELFERLKEIDPQVKMVFMTGYLEEGSKNGILHSGVKKIIHKPFRIEEIIDCIGHVLEN
jgi:CheY-like chemotaxis protein